MSDPPTPYFVYMDSVMYIVRIFSKLYSSCETYSVICKIIQTTVGMDLHN